MPLIALPLFSDIFNEGIWKEAAALEDQSLQGLASRLQRSVLQARAPATTTMYYREFNKWKDFAFSNLKKTSFLPISPIHVALYLQHVLESTRSSSSVDTAFYAIKWARPNKKEPITIEVLNDMVGRADLSNILHLRNVCLYALSYAGFFRSEEVLNIRMNHIYFHEGYMLIKVEKSKTDKLRQGDEVVIAQSGGSKLVIDPLSSEFIFRPLVKTKSSYKLVQNDKPISYTTFRDQLAKSLQNVVPDPSVYGTHSFRSGGASRAANSGVTDRVFQRHGRWKSVAAKDGYVKDDISLRLLVSKSLGL